MSREGPPGVAIHLIEPLLNRGAINRGLLKECMNLAEHIKEGLQGTDSQTGTGGTGPDWTQNQLESEQLELEPLPRTIWCTIRK